MFALSCVFRQTIKGSLCADTILQNEAEFAPFCEFSETVTSFGDYVSRVRNSADWGGHLGKKHTS